MSRQKYWFLKLFILVSLPAMACGLLSGGEQPTAEPTSITVDAAGSESSQPQGSETAVPVEAGSETNVTSPTAVPAESGASAETTGTAVDAASQEVIDAASLVFQPDVDSYQLQIEMKLSGVDAAGNDVVQEVGATLLYTADPLANSVSMNMLGLDGSDKLTELSFVETGGTTYLYSPDIGCSTFPTEGSSFQNPFSEMLDSSALLSELDNAERVMPDETINGIQSAHYVFDETDLKGTEGEVENADGHVYVSLEGGYVVRILMDGRGQLNLFGGNTDQVGDIHFALNLSDVNAPLEVAPPEACLGEAVDFPMLEDASSISSIAGLISYKSTTTVEDAVAFYDEALAAADWVKNEDESSVLSGTAFLSYTRENETANLIIGPSSDTDGIDVVIVIESGG